MLGMLALLVCIAGGVLACGGGGAYNVPPVNNPGTTPGVYAISVQGASGTLTQSTTVTLTVQ
jgi:hypothetical protein